VLHTDWNRLIHAIIRLTQANLLVCFACLAGLSNKLCGASLSAVLVLQAIDLVLWVVIFLSHHPADPARSVQRVSGAQDSGRQLGRAILLFVFLDRAGAATAGQARTMVFYGSAREQDIAHRAFRTFRDLSQSCQRRGAVWPDPASPALD
jgi:hypothetical protein